MGESHSTFHPERFAAARIDSPSTVLPLAEGPVVRICFFLGEDESPVVTAPIGRHGSGTPSPLRNEKENKSGCDRRDRDDTRAEYFLFAVAGAGMQRLFRIRSCR